MFYLSKPMAILYVTNLLSNTQFSTCPFRAAQNLLHPGFKGFIVIDMGNCCIFLFVILYYCYFAIFDML